MLNEWGGDDVYGLSEVAGFMYGLRYRSGHRVLSEKSSDPERHGTRAPGSTPPPPQVVPPLLGLIFEDAGRDLVHFEGMSGAGENPDQPTGPFCAPKCAAHTCDTGGG